MSLAPRSMRRSFTLFAILAAFVLPASLAAQVNEYALRSGDRVIIEAYTDAGDELPELAGTKTIDRQGNIFLPYIGTLLVRGLDAVAIRESLSSALADVYPNAVISVEAEMRVSITGAVGNPNIYYLDPTTTILEAMATAGGIASELAVNSITIPADPTRVRLVRDNATEILNLRPDDLTPDLLERRIQSGDYFYVPARGRSRIRDEITFWGSVIGFITSILILGGIVGGN